MTCGAAVAVGGEGASGGSRKDMAVAWLKIGPTYMAILRRWTI